MSNKWYEKTFVDAALFVTRVSSGLILAIFHGLPKLQGFQMHFHSFADPLGVGSELSYILTVGAEFVCTLLVALGLFTRLATIPVIALFCALFFIHHGYEPLMAREKLFFYGLPFLTIFLAGPGKYALDRIRWGGGAK